METASNRTRQAREARSAEIVTRSLDAMHRSSELAATALELCAEKDDVEMTGQEFVVAVHEAIENIYRWAHGDRIPREVEAFSKMTDEQLIALQEARRFSKIQLIQWTGEIKLRLSLARNKRPH